MTVSALEKVCTFLAAKVQLSSMSLVFSQTFLFTSHNNQLEINWTLSVQLCDPSAVNHALRLINYIFVAFFSFF